MQSLGPWPWRWTQKYRSGGFWSMSELRLLWGVRPGMMLSKTIRYDFICCGYVIWWGSDHLSFVMMLVSACVLLLRSFASFIVSTTSSHIFVCISKTVGRPWHFDYKLQNADVQAFHLSAPRIIVQCGTPRKSASKCNDLKKKTLSQQQMSGPMVWSNVH